jgi:serine/threonine protein kinase
MISSERIDWPVLEQRFKDDGHVRWIIRGIRSRLPLRAIRTGSGMTAEEYAAARRRFCRALEEILAEADAPQPDPLRELRELALSDLEGRSDEELGAEAREDGEDIAALAAFMRARTAEPPRVPAPWDTDVDGRIRGGRRCRQTQRSALRKPARVAPVFRTPPGPLGRSRRRKHAAAAYAWPAGWLAQLRQGLLDEPGFLQRVQDALACGQLDPGTLRAWLGTPAARTFLPRSLARHLTSAAQQLPGGVAQSPRPAVPAPAGLDVGAVVDARYELVERLGGGGMGEVFKAFDRLAHAQRDPDPYVAVKILKSQMQSNQKAVLALQREAHRARRLAHSNIIGVHLFGQDRGTGQYFMVMELLEGRSIESVMDETGKGRPWESIAPLIGQVCAGLAHAHKKGIIHSDIKPRNLFVNHSGEVKILDFGMAAPMPTPSGHETLMDARKLGTRSAAYASTESFLGMTPHYSDDVYSLACVTYEWLSGRPPYARANDPGVPVPAPAAQKLGLQVTPIPALSRRQNRALRQALAHRRNERTQTVEAFWRSMSAAPAASSRRRRRLLAAVIGAALLAAALGTWMLPRPREPPCPQASAPGALDSALGAATRAQAALARLPAGSPQRPPAQARLSRDAQCLRSLAAAGLSSDRSVQLLEEIETGEQAVPTR